MLRLATESDATFAPYSNICPISGWTGAKVMRTGINVWDGQWEVGQIEDTTGAKFTGNRVCSKNYIRCLPNTTYYFYYGGTNYSWNAVVYAYDANKNYLGFTAQTRFTISSAVKTFTTTADTHYLMFQIHPDYGTTYNNNVSINYPSTETGYHAYEGEIYPITFPSSAGTVYGGTLTVNKDGTGTLVVDKKQTLIKNETWTANPEYERLYATINDINVYPFTRQNPLICSAYQTIADRRGIQQVPNMSIYAAGEDNPGVEKRIYIKDIDKCSDATTFVTAMGNEQIVYELATPITYDLTPVEVTTLLGVNNIWADTGDTALTYIAEPKRYINNQISASQRLMELIVTANREDSMKATKAYVQGELMIVNNTLYKASTSIANGATLTVNTNVTATTVAAEIAALA